MAVGVGDDPAGLEADGGLGRDSVQFEDNHHAVAGEPGGLAPYRVDCLGQGPGLVVRLWLRGLGWGCPPVVECEPGQLLAGADDVEGFDKAG